MSIRHILYKLKPFIQGNNVADGEDIELNAAGFDGNLDTNTTDVQTLAQAVDDLELTGMAGTVQDENVVVQNDTKTGLLFGSANAQTAFNRIDNTGLGAQPTSFTGNLFANYVVPNGNQDTWYAGRQANTVIGARGQPNGRYTFRLPDITDLGLMFDDLASRGVAEQFTITIGYLGGNTSSIRRNALTVTAPSVSALFDRDEIPVTIAQGSEVTFRISRVGGSITPWERVGITQSVDPVATLGEVVLQSTGWNNSDGSFLPSAGQVLQGYAYPVIGSNPNDGTLRQGLLDAGVSDRVIYDGDYVIWTASSFTSWTNGNDWFVLPRNDLQRLTREQSNFLAQTTEIDNRADLAPVSMLTNYALVWLSENQLTEAPFLTPSTDPNNPRSGDSYPYVGGRDDRNFMNQFTLGTNRFNNFMTVGITPSFIAGHSLRDIEVRIYDTDRVLLESFNLQDDFVLVDDATFTNSTVTHYQRNTSVNYPFLATIEIWLTQVQRHFRLDQNTVDVTQNIPDRSLIEDKLSLAVQEKLNRAIPPQGVTYNDIADRLSPYANVVTRQPVGNARFLSNDGTGAYPTALSDLTQVPENNPVFTTTNIVLFVAVPEPANFILRNITQSIDTALDNSSPNVEVIESLSDNGVTYFVYRVTGVTTGDRFEVERITNEQVVAWANDIENLEDDVNRIDARLSHAVLDLPQPVVDILDNDITVTEESNPVTDASDYNISLGGTNQQTVFYEPSPVAPSGGIKSSQPLSALTGDQQRQKLLFIPPSSPASQASYITAFNGASTTRDLISFVNGEYRVNVRVPAQPASTVTSTVYPATSTSVSGAGIWQNIPTLTFVNGVPVPEADEVFFTRNLPTTPSVLTIDYRGHANGNIFGTGQATLAGVGGSTEVATSFTINDGSEVATIEIRYYPNFNGGGPQIRASVTERVLSGLPTINDVQVILSYTETRTIPATAGTTRQVVIGHLSDSWKVFAFRAGANGNLFVVSDEVEIDTNRTFETWFGASLGGHISVVDDQATFLNFEDFDPIVTTVTDLEHHASLPQFGLFTTDYTHETTVNLDTQLTVRGAGGDQMRLGTDLILRSANGTDYRLTVDNSGTLITTEIT